MLQSCRKAENLGGINLLAEFKEFIMRGNVMDMAVGVMIGAAFQKIVTSLVDDVITPLLSPITGGISFADLGVLISPAVMDGDTVVKPEVIFKYGAFIQSIIDFVIIALCIFLLVKGINKLHHTLDKKKEEEAVEEDKPTAEQELLTEIRDLLKEKN